MSAESANPTTTARAALAAECHRVRLDTLLPYDSVDPDTSLFINAHSVGFGLRFTPATGVDPEHLKALVTLLNDTVPPGVDVQVTLWANPHIGPHLCAVARQTTQRAGVVADLVRRQLAYLARGARESLLAHEAVYLRDHTGFVFVSWPKRHPGATREAMLALREAVLAALSRVPLHVSALTAPDVLRYLRWVFNPSADVMPPSDAWCPRTPLREQVSDAGTLWRVTPEALVCDTVSAPAPSDDAPQSAPAPWGLRVLRVAECPDTVHTAQTNELLGALLQPSVRMPGSYQISMNVRTLDPTVAHARAQRKILGQTGKARQSALLQWLPGLAQEVQDWYTVRERLNAGACLCEVSVFVSVFAPHAQLDSAERAVQAVYQAVGFRLVRERYAQVLGLLASLPFTASEGVFKELQLSKRVTTMTTFNAVHRLPVHGEWLGTATPLMVLPGRRGQVCGWNPFAHTGGNYNVAIAANSGKGKSVWVQYYVTALLGAKGRAWVIDIGHSYEKTCRHLRGEFLAFSSDTPLSLNPFTGLTQAAFKAQLPLLVPLLATMARQKQPTSEEEDRCIEQAIRAAWQADGPQASMTTVVAHLRGQSAPEAQTVAHLLSSYAIDGMYADFFDGPCAVNFDNPFMVLELLGLKNQPVLQRVVLFALMTRMHQAMYLSERDTYKSCIIDEAWALLGDGGHAAHFIETGYRTARRHNANFVSITQSLQDYYQSDAAKAAFLNADFTVVLGQKAQDVEQLAQTGRFPANDAVKQMLNSLTLVDGGYSECLIQSPQGMSVHRLLLDPYVRVLFSSKGAECEAVKRHQANGLSLSEAVARVAGVA